MTEKPKAAPGRRGPWDLRPVLKQLDRQNYRLFEERVEHLEEALTARTAELHALLRSLESKSVITRGEMGAAVATERRRTCN